MFTGAVGVGNRDWSDTSYIGAYLSHSAHASQANAMECEPSYPRVHQAPQQSHLQPHSHHHLGRIMQGPQPSSRYGSTVHAPQSLPMEQLPSLDCTQTGSLNLPLVGSAGTQTGNYLNQGYPSSHLNPPGVGPVGYGFVPSQAGMTKADLSVGGSGAPKLSMQGSNTGHSGSDREDSPMVGVCVQQSPVVSH